MKIQWHNSWST